MTFIRLPRAFADPDAIDLRFSALLGLTIAALVALCCAAFASADDAPLDGRRAAERRNFTDAEILDGFFKVTFGAEFHVAGGVDRIRKFEAPIRVFIENSTTATRATQVEAAIADIRSRIRNLDIALTKQRDEANMVLSLVRDRDLARTIRTTFGIDRARHIQRKLEPQCLSGFRKDADSRILRSDVIIVGDVGDFVFFDCVYEEILQALGPINDDTSVPWTMFNDDVQMGFFDVYDQYLLNILYDPRIRPGMTPAEVQALLPEVLPAVRAFVDGNNKQP